MDSTEFSEDYAKEKSAQVIDALELEASENSCLEFCADLGATRFSLGYDVDTQSDACYCYDEEDNVIEIGIVG